MPRDGSGVYSLPTGTDNYQPNTSIESAKMNTFTGDIEADANAARPIVAGGTGAASVIGAHDNIVTSGVDIASATSINLTNATGVSVSITGTTTISTVILAEGNQRYAQCSGALPITASASLIVNGATSGTTTFAPGDLLRIQGGAAGVVSVWKANSNVNNYNDKSTTYTALIGDKGDLINFTAAATLNLDSASNLGVNWRAKVKASGGDVTIDPSSSETINGQTTFTLLHGQSTEVFSDGVNFITSSPKYNNRVIIHTAAGYGSTADKIVRYSTIQENTGAPSMTLTQSSANGDSVEIGQDGMYEVRCELQSSDSAREWGITLNQSDLTVNITNISASEQITTTTGQADRRGSCSAVIYLSAGDVIRTSMDGGVLSTATTRDCMFTVTRIW